MTNAELVGYVEAHIGEEKKTKIAKPIITALGTLALKDLAEYLIDNDMEQAKKLRTSATSQSWSSSQFSAPSDMLFHKQREHTIIDIGGIIAFQVEDRKKLFLVSEELSNNYCALEGKVFFIKELNGSTSGNNLNIFYYKIPAISDVDSELRTKFLEFVIQRVIIYGQEQLTSQNSVNNQ